MGTNFILLIGGGFTRYSVPALYHVKLSPLKRRQILTTDSHDNSSELGLSCAELFTALLHKAHEINKYRGGCIRRPSVDVFKCLKNAIFWDVAPCRYCANRRSSETSVYTISTRHSS
jgi:hypothetical protein